MTETISEKVNGFRFAAASAGIKKSGKPDLALIFSEVPARAAGVFTTNKVIAAPLQVTAPRILFGRCQAVLVNSGNANACTGEQGLKDARRCGELCASVLGIEEELVAVSSTGVIGVPLPLDKFERAIPLLPAALNEGGAQDVAQAIRTTDAFPKMASVHVPCGQGQYTLMGIAKGAGMIHPNMATMLGFVMTDAEVEPSFLKDALREAVGESFNSITVDGDTSTNDMVLILANGLAANAPIQEGTAEGAAFLQALKAVLLDLAKMIVRDGEGATKVVRIHVQGALDAVEAKTVARSIATSNLVKTAFFGADANWGRIIAAAGYSGAEVDPHRVSILFDEVPVVREGLSTGQDFEAKATAVLKKPEFTVTVDLGLGEGAGDYYTSDLTYDYVKINSDYRS
ncbi:bifunctional glutamate N-acetyltransferase/amino-acid acetyltransferase ArgJ [Desulfuromonas sp. AOP6]|uniref:bifunctional glutamate N-acetyltransferase/amino-acid acetyltransferase ArgJ n=1 Tax=Desulfuromonas sp. AOP6 TaxID=1566351 RepID=UPI00127CD53A|nr:bifunctional glutamate N-acetyltransferase/amino-acid acetyltransferase ArgJ [Desulfuromonas sp. AOP6]BCA80280.1 arginine biosynthesis bifunctional protein ArgJ [Desulfuromonas sp. AOP6]